MIESGDFKEIAVVCRRTDEIVDRLNDLVGQVQELKLVYPPLWEKDAKYYPFVDKRESLLKILKKREKQKAQQTESENLELKFEKERKYQQQMYEKHRQTWEEKFDAELELAQRKLRYNCKLPNLKITAFKGTSTDWVRFENMFVTQVHTKLTSAEEMVTLAVRGKIGNLKPGTLRQATTEQWNGWGRKVTRNPKSRNERTAEWWKITRTPKRWNDGKSHEVLKDGYARSPIGSQNRAVVLKRQDNSIFLRI